jgi:hypothetical protein
MDSPYNLEDSPLHAVEVDSINELFSRDPEKLTRKDMQNIIKRLRETRKIWAKEEATAKNSGRKVNMKKATGKSVKESKNLTFTQLKMKI